MFSVGSLPTNSVFENLVVALYCFSPLLFGIEEYHYLIHYTGSENKSMQNWFDHLLQHVICGCLLYMFVFDLFGVGTKATFWPEKVFIICFE